MPKASLRPYKNEPNGIGNDSGDYKSQTDGQQKLLGFRDTETMNKRLECRQAKHTLRISQNTQERNNSPQTDNLRKGRQDDEDQQKEKLNPPPRANMPPKPTKKMRKRWTSQKKLRI